jgi:hypothetical protein
MLLSVFIYQFATVYFEIIAPEEKYMNFKASSYCRKFSCETEEFILSDPQEVLCDAFLHISFGGKKRGPTS